MLSERRFGSFQNHHPDEVRQKGGINYANHCIDYSDGWENKRRMLRDRGRYQQYAYHLMNCYTILWVVEIFP